MFSCKLSVTLFAIGTELEITRQLTVKLFSIKCNADLFNSSHVIFKQMEQQNNYKRNAYMLTKNDHVSDQAL
jgi:hypothetical protein